MHAAAHASRADPDALRAGADVLLEKPPVLDRAEHEALVAAEAETGRVVQVGFQALASPALVRLRAAVAGGALGAVRHISVLGCWKRDDAYWARSPWSGRRTVDGRPSLDGALANPFAHAVMQALSVLDAPVERVEVDWLRVRPIEVEDTATLRITLSGGVTVLVAVTLAGEGFVDGDLTVYGERGDAELGFREDLLRLPGRRRRRLSRAAARCWRTCWPTGRRGAAAGAAVAHRAVHHGDRAAAGGAAAVPGRGGGARRGRRAPDAARREHRTGPLRRSGSPYERAFPALVCNGSGRDCKRLTSHSNADLNSR
ncbi:Gfo/Idh/MocA family protein [Catellatospora bangladeshensis]|uniref:Gfo/Idh/MocA family protein n=1 Tax=Catellatospora bangladeshensis TaxID=310355 RepID=UPI003605ED3D